MKKHSADNEAWVPVGPICPRAFFGEKPAAVEPGLSCPPPGTVEPERPWGTLLRARGHHLPSDLSEQPSKPGPCWG